VQELRVDALTGDEVVLAPTRALRPDTFRVAPQPLPAAVATCPFCDGNEHETPPEVARIGPGAPDTPGWRVRVVPNKYPIVGDGVSGAHEVVILSPAHDADFSALTATQATDALLALRDRSQFHLAQGCLYAQPFINHGKAAGASIEHPHAQLVALALVPPRAAILTERFARAERDLVRDDARAGESIGDGDVLVWCAAAATQAFATRVSLASAGPRFDLAGDDEIAAVASALSATIAGLHRALGDAAYNVVIRTAPRDHAGPFHWWVDIVPRLGTYAGFELGTGLWVNIVAPADAAAALRP
jgi:UDPglucose--hexose-1-phosphate uridylyltransferase